MAHAEKCPVCDGTGEYRVKTHVAHIDDKVRLDAETVVCHGCDGKGWVEVADGPYYTIQPAWPPQYDATGDDLRWPNTTYTYSG